MGGCLIGKGLSGKNRGIRVVFGGDDEEVDFSEDDTRNCREEDDRRLVRTYMHEIGKYHLLSPEEVTKVFEDIYFLRDSIDAIILSTRYGRRQYISLEDKLERGPPIETRANIVEELKSREDGLGESGMRREFYHFMDAVRRVRNPRQGMKVWSALEHIRLKEKERNSVRKRFHEDLFAYVEMVSANRSESRVMSALSLYFGLKPSEAPVVFDQIVSFEKLLRQSTDKMANSNLRLVVYVAKRYHVRGMTLMDFVQEGNIGLLKAIDGFDNNLHNHFSTYAPWWIRHEIHRSISDKAATIRYPAHLHETLRKVKKYFAMNPGAEERNDPEEISLAIQKPQRNVELALEAMEIMYADSLDKPMGFEADSRTYISSVEDLSSPNPESEVVSADFDRRMHDIVYSALSSREQDLLDDRFGEEALKLSDVGKKIGRSRERARQIEEDALGKGFKALMRNLDPCIRDYGSLVDPSKHN